MTVCLETNQTTWHFAKMITRERFNNISLAHRSMVLIKVNRNSLTKCSYRRSIQLHSTLFSSSTLPFLRCAVAL